MCQECWTKEANSTSTFRIFQGTQSDSTQVREYKRKCNQCKKVWHVLEDREKQLESNVRQNNCYQGTFCCNPNASLQAKRNVEAGQSDLDELRKCPKCGSSDYKEEVISYDKK